MLGLVAIPESAGFALPDASASKTLRPKHRRYLGDALNYRRRGEGRPRNTGPSKVTD